jgi:hypothetical protein
VVNLSVTGIDGTEAITAENLGTGGLKVYFSALPTDFPDPGMGTIAGGTTEGGTVVEAGFLAGVREYLNVYNAGPAEGNIRITIVG